MWRVVVLLLLAGCASMSEAEREVWNDKRRVDEGNWYACASVYKEYREPTIHRHHHRNGEKRPSKQAVQDDLFDNNCEALLGEEWLEYE